MVFFSVDNTSVSQRNVFDVRKTQEIWKWRYQLGWNYNCWYWNGIYIKLVFEAENCPVILCDLWKRSTKRMYTLKLYTLWKLRMFSVSLFIHTNNKTSLAIIFILISIYYKEIPRESYIHVSSIHVYSN